MGNEYDMLHDHHRSALHTRITNYDEDDVMARMITAVPQNRSEGGWSAGRIKGDCRGQLEDILEDILEDNLEDNPKIVRAAVHR